MQETPDTIVIGSKFWGHDSSVFMVMPEQKRLAAMQTERVTRYKHDRTFPIPALERLIEREKIAQEHVKRVVLCNSFLDIEHAYLPENLHETEMLYRKHFGSPYKKEIEVARRAFQQKTRAGQLFDLLSTPFGMRILFEKALLAIGLKKVRSVAEIERAVLRQLFPRAEIEIRFYDHEYCHVACAYTTAPFKTGLVCSIDGWGDGHFSRVYIAQEGVLEPLAQSPDKAVPGDPKLYEELALLPSLGGIYSHFTERLGFTPEEDEGKVEALAAYGKPIPDLVDELKELVSTDTKLSLKIDVNELQRSLGPERFDILLQEHSKEDLSATVQEFLEQTTIDYFSHIKQKLGIEHVALAGGVAANVINNLGMYEKITPSLHITPAMGDDGSAQGAAYAYMLEQGMDTSWIKALQMPYYETQYSKEDVRGTLKNTKAITFEDLGELWPERTAELVAAGKIGALFHGRAEWGPRALGHRSIIADTRRKDFRDIINKTIKRRPLFQPFCPSMLAEERERLFESAYLNKHMTCAFRLKKEYWDVLPSAMHIDGTARVQFVEEGDDINYYRLLKKVKELTGYGVVINTSFNKHGRTIVESPQDAIKDFLDTDMDYMIIEGFLITRA